MRIPSLEEVLRSGNLVDEAGLGKALTIQKEKGISLKDALVGAGILSDVEILKALGRQWDIEFMHMLGELEVDPAILDHLPVAFLRRYNMVPVKWQGETLIVAVNDPLEQEPLFDIGRVLAAKDIRRVLASRQEIHSAINRLNDLKNESAQDIVNDMEEEEEEDILHDLENIQDITVMETDAPIIKLVNRLMVQAFRERASDIHVEPFQSEVKIRFRVDGILHDVLGLPKRIQSAVVSRIKVMANLNIAEKRLPQDGRIGIKLGEHSVDLRVSTVPTVGGERVVMRILDKSSVLLGLEELGFYPDDMEIIAKILKQEHGIVLVTGPTGSGKTTTLYATLQTHQR